MTARDKYDFRVIKVTYTSIDRYRMTRSYKTLKGARKFAIGWLGKYPEMGSTYAVSGDGIGKITASGVALEDLFGDEPANPNDALDDFNYVGSRHHY